VIYRAQVADSLPSQEAGSSAVSLPSRSRGPLAAVLGRAAIAAALLVLATLIVYR
jgi:hypothetical protein